MYVAVCLQLEFTKFNEDVRNTHDINICRASIQYATLLAKRTLNNGSKWLVRLSFLPAKLKFHLHLVDYLVLI